MIQNAAAVLALSTLVAAGAGAAAALLTRGETSAATPADTGPTGALERVARELERLGERQAALEREFARLGERPALATPQPGHGTRTSADEIDAAVARWMAAHGGDSAGPAATASEAAAPDAGDRVAAALARLDDPELGELERQALWRELAAEGLTDELVAAYEARAEASPNDPDAQVAAAGAYLAKIFEVGQGPEAGVWATRADSAFDRALELDEHHWDARFQKAVSLSFWPPVFGKQGEAIRQFELLVEQQRTRPAEPRFAQTHLLLGNMYRQIGEEDRAAQAWRNGLALYPGNEALAGQLEVFGSGQ